MIHKNLMRLSDKKMPLPLSGKMSVILPCVLPLVSFSLFVISAIGIERYIAATHRDPDELGAVFAVAFLYVLVTVPCCCAIAFCRSDKAAVIVFLLGVISLLLVSCVFFVRMIPGPLIH